MVYVRRGYLVPPGIESVLQQPDPDARLQEFARQAQPIEDCFIVPPRIFSWLMKQAAQARRLEPPPTP